MMLVERIALVGRDESLGELRDFLASRCERAEVTAEVAGDLQLAAEEVVVNIITYGYRESAGSVNICLEISTGHLVVEFVDRAAPFDPLAAPEPELGQSIDQAPVGGLGIALIKRLSHEQQYSYRDGQNCLRLKWYLSQSTHGPEPRDIPMTLNTDIDSSRPGVQRVRIGGRLDTTSAPELEARLSNLPANIHTLVFDMANLDYISSAGLRVVFKASKSVRQAGGKAVLANLQPQIRKVFDIVKAMPDVTIFSSDAELDDYLDTMQRRVLDGDDAII